MGCGASPGAKPLPPPEDATTPAPKDAAGASAKSGYEAADAPKAAAAAPAAADAPKADGVAPIDASAKSAPEVSIAPASEVPEVAPPNPCLHYYPFAGRGELSRLIAAVGGLEMDSSIELEDKAPFGSAGSWPCFEHGPLKISQTFAIESYVARIAPGLKDLTPSQRAVDNMFCKTKDDILSGCVFNISLVLSDASQKEAAIGDIVELCDKWFPIIEGRLPAAGFVNGLAFPTVADLAVLNISRGFMPFGAAYLMAGYNITDKFPKFSAHVDRVAAYPAVKDYLVSSTTMDADPMGLKAPTESKTKEEYAAAFVPAESSNQADWVGTCIDMFSPDDTNPDSRRFMDLDEASGELQVSADTGGEKWGRRFDKATSVNPILVSADTPNARKTSFLSKVPKDAPVYAEAEAGALNFTLILGTAFGQKVIKWNGLYDGQGGKFGGEDVPPSDCGNFWRYV